nr:endolytic transglycosylase MltG [Deltaproteobacteria bacterium]
MAGRPRPVAKPPSKAPAKPSSKPPVRASRRSRSRGAPPRRPLAIALAVLAAVAALCAFGVFVYLRTPHRGRGRPVRITVAEGADSAAVTRALWSAGVIDHPWLFHMLAAVTGVADRAHRGTVALRDDLTPYAVLRTLNRGVAGLIRVTIPEGYTRFDIARRLESAGVCSAADFIAHTEDPALLQRYGLSGSLEGYLFPDTYDLPPDSPAGRVVERMVAELSRHLREVKASHPDGVLRAASLSGSDEGPASPSPGGFDRADRLIVTLASLVERETGSPDDRAHVASVFWNRLRLPDFRPRLLQSDPTVVYGCTVMAARGTPLASCDRGDGGVRRGITGAMLMDRSNPYNTYQHEGVPPGAIANPGAAALSAVLAPTSDQDLYFVAMGSGRSAFAPTLEEHRRNVQRYLRRGDAGVSP